MQSRDETEKKMKGKVKMSAIEDVNDRRTTYRKRKETLVRKMEEITTMCGIEGSLIVFNELEAGGGLQMWPANHEALQRVVEKVRALSVSDIGKKREKDMNSWSEVMLEREKRSLSRLELSIEDREARRRMSAECFGGRSVKHLSADELKGLKYVIDEKFLSLRSRFRNLMMAADKPAGLEDSEDQDPDPDIYLNLDFADNTANHGMNMIAAEAAPSRAQRCEGPRGV